MDYTKFHPVEQAEMQSCVLPVIYKCFDDNPIGTEFSKMGTFKKHVLAVKVNGNAATFSLPSDGPMESRVDYLTKEDRNGTTCPRHYNRTDSIMYDIAINGNELTMTFYTKEFKIFTS